MLAGNARSSGCNSVPSKAVTAASMSDSSTGDNHQQQQTQPGAAAAGSASTLLSHHSNGPVRGSSSSSSSSGGSQVATPACEAQLQPLYRGLLQSSADGSSITTPVSGRVVVQEAASAAPPTLQDDTKRGDGLTFLDADGSVLLIGAAQVPPSSIPSWKETSPDAGKNKKSIPTWIWWAVIGGAVLLAMAIGVACLVALASRRRQQGSSGSHHGPPHEAPQQQQLQEGGSWVARSGASLTEPHKQHHSHHHKSPGSRHNARGTGRSHRSMEMPHPLPGGRLSPRSRYRPTTAPEEAPHNAWQGPAHMDLTVPGAGEDDGQGHVMLEAPPTTHRHGRYASSHQPAGSGGRRDMTDRRSVEASIPSTATLSEHWVQEPGEALPPAHSRGRGQRRPSKR
jgi:hypothetical protein